MIYLEAHPLGSFEHPYRLQLPEMRSVDPDYATQHALPDDLFILYSGITIGMPIKIDNVPSYINIPPNDEIKFSLNQAGKTTGQVFDELGLIDLTNVDADGDIVNPFDASMNPIWSMIRRMIVRNYLTINGIQERQIATTNPDIIGGADLVEYDGKPVAILDIEDEQIHYRNATVNSASIGPDTAKFLAAYRIFMTDQDPVDRANRTYMSNILVSDDSSIASFLKEWKDGEESFANRKQNFLQIKGEEMFNPEEGEKQQLHFLKSGMQYTRFYAKGSTDTITRLMRDRSIEPRDVVRVPVKDGIVHAYVRSSAIRKIK